MINTNVETINTGNDIKKIKIQVDGTDIKFVVARLGTYDVLLLSDGTKNDKTINVANIYNPKNKNDVVNKLTNVLIKVFAKQTTDAKEITDSLLRELYKNAEHEANICEERSAGMLCGCIIPKGYGVAEDDGACGITKKIFMKDEIEIPKKIANCVSMITGYYTSKDSESDHVSLQYTAPDAAIGGTGGKAWREILVPVAAIRVGEVFRKELIPQGLSVESTNTANILEYYSECIHTNLGAKNSAFKTGFAYDVNGWKDEAFTEFVSGDRLFKLNDGNVIKTDCIFLDSRNTESGKKLSQKGDVKKWAEAAGQILIHPIVRFIAAQAVASVLVRPLKSKPCTVGMQGLSSIGKTLTEMIAASHFGNPDERSGLIITGDISMTALQSNMRAYCDHPLFIDETTNMKDEMKKTLAYIATNGQEAARGKRDSTLREQKMLVSNLFVTSEASIISDRAQNGTDARTIIFERAPMPKMDQNQIKNVRDGITGNYGHIIEMFLSKFACERDTIKTTYCEALKRLQSTIDDKRKQRQAEYYASAEVALTLLDDIYAELGISQPQDDDCNDMDASAVVDMMWGLCVLKNHYATLETKALASTYDFFTRNANTHFGYDSSKAEIYRMGEIYGWVSELYIDFIPTELKKALKDDGFTDPDTIIKNWRDVGILQTQKPTSVVRSAHHYFAGDVTKSPVSVIRMKKQKIIEILEITDDEEHEAEISKFASEYQKQQSFIKI
jgi:uncharacterized protein (DUF927 family)